MNEYERYLFINTIRNSRRCQTNARASKTHARNQRKNRQSPRPSQDRRDKEENGVDVIDMPKKHGEGNRQIDGTSAERKEKPPYKWNLLTNFDETVRAIADIEGIPKEDVAKWIQHEMESTSFVALGPIMRDLKSPRLADRRSQHPNERVFSQTLYGSG